MYTYAYIIVCICMYICIYPYMYIHIGMCQGMYCVATLCALIHMHAHSGLAEHMQLLS